MVDIIYDPVKALVVHDVAKVPLEDLIRERITPGVTLPLYWCGGILFSFASAPISEEIMKDYFKGRIHWMEVHYTEMKEYKPVLELNDENYSGKMNIRIIDTAGAQLHKDFVRWLKAGKR